MIISISYELPELYEVLKESLEGEPRLFITRILHEVHVTLKIPEPKTVSILIIPDSGKKQREGWVQEGMPMVVRVGQEFDITVAHEYIHRRFPALGEPDVERYAQEIADRLRETEEETISL